MADHRDTGYDLFALAAAAASRATSLEETARVIASTGMRPLQAALESMRASQPNIFERQRAGLTPGVILARWSGDGPAFGYIRFVPKVLGLAISVSSEVRLCPGRDCPAGLVGVFVGPVVAETQEFQDRHPNYATGDIAGTARQFVQEQIDRRRPSVGPPIDVIRLKLGKVEWVQRKAKCSPEHMDGEIDRHPTP